MTPPPATRWPLRGSIGRSAMSAFASGEGGASGVRATPLAQAAWKIARAIGTETWPPVWPRPRVRRTPSALS